MRGSDIPFIVISGVGILVFRSELMLFYGPLLLFGLVFGLIKLRPNLILAGIATTIGAIGLSQY